MENILQLRPKQAVDYSLETLHQKLASLEKLIRTPIYERHHRKIRLSTFETTYYVDSSQIIRCESMGNYCKVHIEKQGSILVSKTLKHIASLLPRDRFIKTHQSHLVNIDLITKAHKNGGLKLELLDGSLIPVSRAEKNNVHNHLRNL